MTTKQPIHLAEELRATTDPHVTRKLITVPEALNFLPLSRENLYRKIKCGVLPSYRVGRRIMVVLDEIMEAMRFQKDGDS